jgi:hypothetical protein
VLKRFQLLQQTQLQLSSTTVVGVVGGVLAIAFGQTAWHINYSSLWLNYSRLRYTSKSYGIDLICMHVSTRETFVHLMSAIQWNWATCITTITSAISRCYARAALIMAGNVSCSSALP